MFAILKNIRSFAVPKIIIEFVSGVFLCTANCLYANITGYQIPLGNTATSSVMVFGETTGGDSLFYIHFITNKFSSKMPNSTKITAPANNSSQERTSCSTKTANISAAQHNQTGNNISAYKSQIKIINQGITAEELETILRTIFQEMIQNGLVSIVSNSQNNQ